MAMTELPALPVLLIHGPVFFWAAFALAALLGPLIAWLIARSRARRRTASALDALGRPDVRLEPADGQVGVFSGVLELEGTGALRCDPRGVPEPEAGRAFLRVGDTRIALDGGLRILAGSRERWGARWSADGASRVDASRADARAADARAERGCEPGRGSCESGRGVG